MILLLYSSELNGRSFEGMTLSPLHPLGTEKAPYELIN